jgi:hypothetical protein
MRLWWSRWSDVWRCRTICELIFCIVGIQKKRLGRRLGSDDLISRMALQIHYLPSGRLKLRLCWSRWRDVSWCRKDKRTHFLYSVIKKKLFGRSRGSVD